MPTDGYCGFLRHSQFHSASQIGLSGLKKVVWYVNTRNFKQRQDQINTK